MADDPQHRAQRVSQHRGVVLAALAITVLAVGALFGWQKLGAPSERRNDLWRVVHVVCGSNQHVLKRPTPCIVLDEARGFALLPGGLYSDELLVVPTRRITGIEAPALLDPDTPNYWALAWGMRRHLLKGVRAVPDAWIGLAVNSALSRTQDQLHIHIDCIRPEVRAALDLHPPAARRWRRLEAYPGRHYEARRFTVAELQATSPFRIVADVVGADPDTMARQTWVVIGAPRASDGPSIYLLRQGYRSEPRSTGHAEELLDHRCVGLKNADPDLQS